MKKRLNLKTVNRVTWVLLLAIAAALVLTVVTKAFFFVYIAFALTIIVVPFEMIFNRCPHCRKSLRRFDFRTDSCPHCGNKLEE